MTRFWLAPLVALLATTASAAPLELVYDSLRESKTTTVRVTAANPIGIEGRLDASGAILDTLDFRAGSTSLSMSAGWLLAPPTNRTVGFNIDLFDFNNNLVVSDTFLGVNGTLATSQFVATNLVAGGAYRMVVTGTGVGTGRYRIDLADGAVPPTLPAIPPVTTDPADLLFDTHVGTKAGTSRLSTGGALRVEGILQADGLHAITNTFTIRINSNGLAGGMEWIVGTLDDPQRTVGVNLDVFDFNNVLVLSDTFVGVTGGQAFSQFVGSGLFAGDYTFVLTGTGVNDRARYRLDLVGGSTAPGFAPIVDATPAAVPEPEAALLLLLGAGIAGMLRRKKRIQSARCGAVVHSLNGSPT